MDLTLNRQLTTGDYYDMLVKVKISIQMYYPHGIFRRSAIFIVSGYKSLEIF